MSDVKYQIFVSSTYTDLVEERKAVSRSILDLGHIPAGMEMFPAADVEQLAYIKKIIDECDYYIIILGARYGSLDEQGVSYTEREYEYALETGKTVLAFLHSDIDSIELGKTDKDDKKLAKLTAFRDKVRKGRLVQHWSNAHELAAQVIVSLTRAFSMYPQIGWVRANSVPNEGTVSDVLRYREEADKLRAELSRAKSQVTPKFPDAVDLSRTVSVNFTYRSGTSSYKSAQVMSYAQFLRCAAPSLHNPTTINNVSQIIGTALIERFGKSGTSLTPKLSDIQDALLHLVATGHVKMWSGTTKDGNTNVTGYQLTPLGVKTWQEMSYVKEGEVEVNLDDSPF